MPVECYSWQVHPSWIGRGWQAILGTVPGEACVSEDLCQWSVTPGRSTQAGLVEGDRPYWGQSLVKPVCLKTYASGVLPLTGPPKLDWSRVTGQTGAGTVAGEACESEDPCQWSVTRGRSTQSGLVQVECLAWDQPTLASILFHRDRARWRTRISL